LTKLWSYKLIATAIANLPEINIGPGMLHSDLQILFYKLVDMHKLTTKIQEVIALPKWLSVK
jgi:hypothetical protein